MLILTKKFSKNINIEKIHYSRAAFTLLISFLGTIEDAQELCASWAISPLGGNHLTQVRSHALSVAAFLQSGIAHFELQLPVLEEREESYKRQNLGQAFRSTHPLHFQRTACKGVSQTAEGSRAQIGDSVFALEIVLLVPSGVLVGGQISLGQVVDPSLVGVDLVSGLVHGIHPIVGIDVIESGC